MQRDEDFQPPQLGRNSRFSERLAGRFFSDAGLKSINRKRILHARHQDRLSQRSSAVRCRLAKNIRAVQNMERNMALRQRDEAWYTVVLASAVIIQMWYRGNQAVAVAQNRREERALQKIRKGFAKWIFNSRSAKAATRLQALVRMRQAMKQRQRCSSLVCLAVKLQTLLRRKADRRRAFTRTIAAAAAAAAATATAPVLAVRVDDIFKHCVLQNIRHARLPGAAAATIQRIFRKHISRRRDQHRLEKAQASQASQAASETERFRQTGGGGQRGRGRASTAISNRRDQDGVPGSMHRVRPSIEKRRSLSTEKALPQAAEPQAPVPSNNLRPTRPKLASPKRSTHGRPMRSVVPSNDLSIQDELASGTRQAPSREQGHSAAAPLLVESP
jgi:hypothetical protein